MATGGGFFICNLSINREKIYEKVSVILQILWIKQNR